MGILEKSEKLPKEHRYFNISVIWIFYYRVVLRVLYYLKIPHEVVTGLSITCGLVSAGEFYYGHFILAAILLHFKDIFDACDGALARLTGRGHLVGRYLDSLGDFLVLSAVVWAIAIRTMPTGTLHFAIWAAAAQLSIFIQCSFFNFYQLAYLEQHESDRLISKKDEVHRNDLNVKNRSLLYRFILGFFRVLYIVIYSWQDKFVARVDRLALRLSGKRDRAEWYGSKVLMTLVSPLCFGTHIFIIIACTLLGHPEIPLKIIIIFMNLYLILFVIGKVLYFRFSSAKN